MKRNNNTNTYKVETEKFIYLVNLKRLNNDANGCPRFNANVIVLIAKVDNETLENKERFYTYNYTFKGHYNSEENECKELVRQIEEER